MWAHWRHLANMIELVLPSVHPSTQPKGKSISSAISAQLTAESPYTLQLATPFPQNCSFTWGDLESHLTHDSLAHPRPLPKLHLNWFSRFCRLQSVLILYNGTPLSPFKIAPYHGGLVTWFPGPTRVLNPNGILIGSAIFARLTSDTTEVIAIESQKVVANWLPWQRPLSESYLQYLQSVGQPLKNPLHCENESD